MSETTTTKTCGECRHFCWHGCGDTRTYPENRKQHLGKDGVCPHVAWPKGWWPHLMSAEPACEEWFLPLEPTTMLRQANAPNPAGIAYSSAVPQPGMAPDYHKSDQERFESAWHAAHCLIENCEDCQRLCDEGFVISCCGCGHVHHTDWLGWSGEIDENGGCTVLCPECAAKGETK